LNRGFLLAWLPLALLCFHCHNLLAQPTAREQLERFAHDLQTYSAKFQQRVIGNDGKVEDESAGTVWLSQPHFIRWEYGGDFPELVVADGQHVWIYDEVLEQVTVKPQSDLVANSPLSLLTDVTRLDEQFEVREAGDMDGMALLELRSIDADAEFERILLGLQQDDLKLMTMEDAFGLRTEVRFSEPQRNRDLGLELFSFTPPPGVDIVGDLQADAAGQ